MKLQGDWQIDWTPFRLRYGIASYDELCHSNLLPDLNDSPVDDFCPVTDANGEITEPYLRILPFGPNSSVINNWVEDCDMVVYVRERTKAPSIHIDPDNITRALHELKKDQLVEMLKQRGWHGETAYVAEDGSTRQVAVWGSQHHDRKFHEGKTGYAIMHIFRPEFPSFEAARVARLKKEIRKWKAIFNKHRFPADGDLFTGSHRYLDPADFCTPQALAEIARRLIDRSPNETPDIGSVTCVQWAYQTVCLALNFPLNRRTLTNLGVFDAYVANWMPALGETDDDLLGLDVLPLKPYSPAEVLQESLNTYAPGHRIIESLGEGRPLTALLHSLLASIDLPGFADNVAAYLDRVAESGDITLPLKVGNVEMRFVMPIAFYCASKKGKPQNGHAPWFRYVGTAVHETCVERRG